MVELQQYADADSSGNVPTGPAPEENPLNSEDDMSSDDEDMDRLFQSNDKFLCQFEKVRLEFSFFIILKAFLPHFNVKIVWSRSFKVCISLFVTLILNSLGKKTWKYSQEICKHLRYWIFLRRISLSENHWEFRCIALKTRGSSIWRRASCTSKTKTLPSRKRLEMSTGELKIRRLEGFVV